MCIMVYEYDHTINQTPVYVAVVAGLSVDVGTSHLRGYHENPYFTRESMETGHRSV